jgi:hypothetical protein
MTNLSVRDSAVGAVERLRRPIDNHMKTDLSNGGTELSHDRKNPTVYDTLQGTKFLHTSKLPREAHEIGRYVVDSSGITRCKLIKCGTRFSYI